MSHVRVRLQEHTAEVLLSRGKVNALDPAVIEQLGSVFESLKSQPEVRAVILSAEGKFFSFGFDIPEFLSYARDRFTGYLESFTALYRAVFSFPKPVVAALNGHTIAGGCMIALACDRVIMAEGRARIALNEITFGSTVFAGSVAMLRLRVGARADEMLYSGNLLAPREALGMGLVDEVVASDDLLARAREIAGVLGARRAEAFADIKRLLRHDVAATMARDDPASIERFVAIWYSEPTWSNLRGITIR